MIISQIAFGVVILLNKDISDTIRNGMQQKRLTMMLLKDPNNRIHLDVFGINYAWNSTWTRGDETRYKEMSYIHIVDSKYLKYTREYATFKRLFPNKEDLLKYLSEQVQVQVNGKLIGTMTDPLNRDRDNVYKSKGMIWVNRPWGVEYGSPSVLKGQARNFKELESL